MTRCSTNLKLARPCIATCEHWPKLTVSVDIALGYKNLVYVAWELKLNRLMLVIVCNNLEKARS